MAETLGLLCDKLTIVKLKQWHTEDSDRLASLKKQEQQLSAEIDEYISDATKGNIDLARLTFPANKVYKDNDVFAFTVANSASFGAIFAQLAEANCELWHAQEKVFDFKNVPIDQKDHLVEQLAVLNLRRTKCIDEIDRQFAQLIITKDSRLSEGSI